MNAVLHLQASLREHVTYLKHSYFSPPLKIANVTEYKKGHDLHLMLMSSSPGILDGDDYTLDIQIDADCSLYLHTQSYQRLFTMKTGAVQTMKVALQKGASFVYLPHPVVPHQHAFFIAKNEIYMAEACSLIWGEILTCGRKLNGEIFQLSKYQNTTSIYLNTRLVIKENLLLEPAIVHPVLMGQLGNYTHQASLIILDEALDIPITKEHINSLLSEEQGIDFGITTAPTPGIIVRILGYKAEQLYSCLQAISTIVKTAA